MFEYLMPLLVMPTYENTLLDQTYVAAVERQIEYGRQRGVPWGMSESGYNTVDVHLNYQYRAFGVPGLGLKRGLGEDLVVAPYASALALMVAPEAACLNLQRLAAAGLAGRLGLFEAIDYTPSRQRRGESSAVVRSFMAHHQAMSLLSFAYVLLARPMQKRFESDPLFQATLLLLQERIPESHAVSFECNRSFRSPRGRRRPGAAGARAHHPGHGDSGGAVAVERPLPRDGHECRRRQQSLEGSGRDPLARRQHVRQLGHLLLSARRGERRVLVDRVSAHAQAGGPLRSDLLGGAGGVSTQRSRFRDAYRDRGFARRRHRSPAGPHHQPVPDSPDDRRHELRGGGSRAGGRRRIASGVQQSLRANRDHAGTARNSLHSPSTLRSKSTCRGCFI